MSTDLVGGRKHSTNSKAPTVDARGKILVIINVSPIRLTSKARSMVKLTNASVQVYKYNPGYSMHHFIFFLPHKLRLRVRKKIS